MILKDATSIQLDNFKNEITSFFNRVRKISQQIKSSNEDQLNNLILFIDVKTNYLNNIYLVYFNHNIQK